MCKKNLPFLKKNQLNHRLQVKKRKKSLNNSFIAFSVKKNLVRPICNFHIKYKRVLGSAPPDSLVEVIDGKITQVFGQVKKLSDFAMIAVHHYDIPYLFQVNRVPQKKLNGRENLRNLDFLTIDGEDAKDFDDAIFAKKNNNAGFELIIAIADVSSFVLPNTALDREALDRGMSVYLPNFVIPMLPHKLSSDICSLKPGKDRACLALFITLDSNGKLEDFRFSRALICSKARLTYLQVQKAKNGVFDQQTKHVKHVLETLWEIDLLLKKQTLTRGILNLFSLETEFVFDNEQNISDVKMRENYSSHQLVERLMVLANTIVANVLTKHKRQIIYRVHDEPPLVKRELLQQELDFLGMGKLPQKITPSYFNNLLQRAKKKNLFLAINMLVLRAQAQAKYDILHTGHFGLKLKEYCHFTSPIRRYVDLTVHREIIDLFNLYLPGEKPFSLSYDKKFIAEYVSSVERRAMAVERDTIKRYASIYFSQYQGVAFEGFVSGAISVGIFVTLFKGAVDCFVPIISLPSDQYKFDPKRKILFGQRHQFYIGKKCKVKIVNTDPVSASISASYIECLS